MQTVKFVLSPLNNIVSLNEVNINHVDLVIDRIKSNGDKFFIPNDFIQQRTEMEKRFMTTCSNRESMK